MTPEQEKKCKQIYWHYGPDPQLLKTIEELQELQDELNSMVNGTMHDINNVIDEVADVYIMVEQMRYLFGARRVDERINYKLDRQLKRIADSRPIVGVDMAHGKDVTVIGGKIKDGE